MCNGGGINDVLAALKNGMSDGEPKLSNVPLIPQSQLPMPPPLVNPGRLQQEAVLTGHGKILSVQSIIEYLTSFLSPRS